MIRSSTWMIAPVLLALLACKGGSRAEGGKPAAEGTAPRGESKAESADRAASAAVPASSSKGGTLALSVIEGRSGVEDTGFLHIIGEIRNDTSKWIESPKVAVVLMDAQGKPIGVDSIAAADGFGESALGMRHNVPPGEVSPFHYIRDIKKLARPYASHKLEPKAFPADSSFNATVADVKTDKENIGKTEYWRITGTVKNMVLHDRSGRAIVKVVLAKTNDPAEVRRVLLAIAKAHPLVLSFPEPLVLFNDFDASSMTLQLVCFISDNGKSGVVASDIRFRCFEEFAAHGISLPLAFPGDVASPRQIGEHSPQSNP